MESFNRIGRPATFVNVRFSQTRQSQWGRALPNAPRPATTACFNTQDGIVKLPALVFNGRMNMPTMQPLSYSGYRFPAVIISHCTWLYFRFALSYRDVAEMMAERGVTVSYETIREWSQKFGGTYAKRMRSKRHPANARSRSLTSFGSDCGLLRDRHGDRLRHSTPSPISSDRWTACRSISARGRNTTCGAPAVAENVLVDCGGAAQQSRHSPPLGCGTGAAVSSAMEHLRIRSIRGFPPTGRTRSVLLKCAAPSPLHGSCFRSGKRPGARAQAHEEVLRCAHEPSRCLPFSHDRNVRRFRSPHDRCRFPHLPST